MDKLDPTDPRAPYVQVADLFRRQITSGTIDIGDKLPGYDAVAAGCGVARGTAKRAYETLQDEGLVVIRPGQGSFVRARVPEAGAKDLGAALAAVQAALADLTRRVEVIERRGAVG